MPDISVILPALSVNNEFLRCVHSIKAALSGRLNIEIICVVRDCDAFRGIDEPDLFIIEEECSGIYGAMNTGIMKATGKYLYFIGQDDVLLPSAAGAISRGKAQGAHLIIADVFWGEGHIFRNKLSRNTLVWRNWCHQGLFYERLKFLESVKEFPVKFKVQADHYSNIVFTSDAELVVIKYESCVAWYSSEGFSSRTIDSEFRHAFPKIIKKHFGFTFFSIVVVRRALLGIVRKIMRAK